MLLPKKDSFKLLRKKRREKLLLRKKTALNYSETSIDNNTLSLRKINTGKRFFLSFEKFIFPLFFLRYDEISFVTEN